MLYVSCVEAATATRAFSAAFVYFPGVSARVRAFPWLAARAVILMPLISTCLLAKHKVTWGLRVNYDGARCLTTEITTITTNVLYGTVITAP